MLGTGKTKIQLCNDSGVEQDSRTLEGYEIDSLCQVKFVDIYDTDGPLEMESGDTKYPHKGFKIALISIDITYVTDVHAGAWETFLEDLADWTQKIKITPNVDAASDTYWVRRLNSWDHERRIKYLMFEGVIQFKGVELLSGVS
jgi:hypothetical protein